MGKAPDPDLTVLHIHRIEGSSPGADVYRVQLLEKSMKDLVEKFRKQEEAVDKAIARVQEDVQKFREKLADLQGKIDAGTVTPEDLAEIQAIHDRTIAKANGLDPEKSDTIPVEGETPPSEEPPPLEGPPPEEEPPPVEGQPPAEGETPPVASEPSA